MIAAHFENVLLQFINNAEATPADINLLTNAERERLLLTFNDTAVPYLHHQSITHLIEQQARQHPEAIALVFEDVQLSYHELNQQGQPTGALFNGQGN
jgi:non-ribosomal peptide synthetase component F